MAPHVATNPTATKKSKARGPMNNNKAHVATPKTAAKKGKTCGTSKDNNDKENAGVHLVYQMRPGEVYYPDMAKALAATQALKVPLCPKQAPRIPCRSTRPKTEKERKKVSFAKYDEIWYIGRTRADIEARRGWEPAPRKPSPAPRKPSILDFGWGLFDKARKLATSFVTGLCDLAGRAYEMAEDKTVYAMLLGLTGVRLVREAVQDAGAKAAALSATALQVPISLAAGACDAVEGAATFLVRMGLTGDFLARQAVSRAVSRVPLLGLLGW